MIDDILNRFRSTESEPEPDEIDISSWADDSKRNVAFNHQYRCVHCHIPNFREKLYLEENGNNAVVSCESCLRERGKDIEITEEREVPAATLGDLSYLIEQPVESVNLRHRSHGNVEIEITDASGEVYAGRFARQLVEDSASTDQLWLGYYQKGNKIQELGIDITDLFEHVFVQGTTGGGKSTWALFVIMQLIWRDFGVCVIDPHGDLIEDVLQRVPPHRRKDVVIFDPTGNDDYHVPFNLFEIEKEPGEDGYHEAVDRTVADVRSGMRRGGDWGNRMGPICDNISRGMVMHPDTFTFVDMRDMFIHEGMRQEFANKINSQGFKFGDYTQQVAEMGEVELKPLIRRLNGWTDSKITRDIISPRESMISYNDIIKNNRIFLMNMNLPDPNVQQMISSSAINRFWGVAESQPKGQREPFVVVADEMDDILNPEMQIEEMLGNARKYKFGLILMTQYLKKLDDSKVERAVKKLCNTKITYRDPDGDFEKSDSKAAQLDNYRALVKMRIDGSMKGPYKMNGVPPYPPRRTRREAREWVREPALRRYGVPKAAADQDDNPLAMNTEAKHTTLKAIYDSELIDGDDDGVKVQDARPRIIERHPNGDDIDNPSEIDKAIAEIPAGENGDLERFEDEDGDIRLKTTAKGRKHIWQTGENVQSGGVKHTQLLMDAYPALTQLGAQVDIPSEQSTGSMPDATLDLDPNADSHPVLDRLTDGAQAVIEAESATGRTKPGKTCVNVRKAVENGQRCLLLCRPDDAEQIWSTIHDPPFMSSQTVEGQHRLYNVRNLTIDGQIMLRPADATETVWSDEPDGPGFVLRDSNGNEFHRFGSEKAVFNDIGAYPHALPAGDDIPEQWTRVKAPFIPSDGLSNASEQVDIVIVPRDADQPDDLQLFQNGHHVPLTELHDWENQHEREEIADSLRDILNDDE